MFKAGQVYNRKKEIHKMYDGQTQGGISTPAKHNIIFLFTGDSGKSYGYKDEFKDDGTFWYTGEGQKGHMEMVRGNKAIRDHVTTQKTMYLFEYIKTATVRCVGEATYLGHHIEERPDANGNLRKAYVFELEIANTDKPEQSKNEPLPSVTNWKTLWTKPLKDLRTLASFRTAKETTTKERRQITRVRSEAVKVYVQRRAEGICEACKEAAPFRTKKGRPYLEPHHTRRMADGGPDDPQNVAAICPNCHQEIHYGVEGDNLNKELMSYLEELEK